MPRPPPEIKATYPPGKIGKVHFILLLAFESRERAEIVFINP